MSTDVLHSPDRDGNKSPATYHVICALEIYDGDLEHKLIELHDEHKKVYHQKTLEIV